MQKMCWASISCMSTSCKQADSLCSIHASSCDNAIADKFGRCPNSISECSVFSTCTDAGVMDAGAGSELPVASSSHDRAVF